MELKVCSRPSVRLRLVIKLGKRKAEQQLYADDQAKGTHGGANFAADYSKNDVHIGANIHNRPRNNIPNCQRQFVQTAADSGLVYMQRYSFIVKDHYRAPSLRA